MPTANGRPGGQLAAAENAQFVRRPGCGVVIRVFQSSVSSLTRKVIAVKLFCVVHPIAIGRRHDRRPVFPDCVVSRKISDRTARLQGRRGDIRRAISLDLVCHGNVGEPTNSRTKSGRLDAAVWRDRNGTGLTFFVALFAFEIQQLGVAPAVVFPLVVGAAAGGSLLLAERLVGLRLRRGRWMLAALCSLAAVVGQEAIGYVKVQRPQEAARLSDPRLELFRDEGFVPEPTSFPSYLSTHVQNEPLWWTLDLLLAVASGVGVILCWGKPQIQPARKEPLG